MPGLLTVSGSPPPQSGNSRLLAALTHLTDRPVAAAPSLDELPIFQPRLDQAPWPDAVLRWRSALRAADAVVCCTPAYLHNIPGVLKNALDWLASSGELDGKPVLALTLTPAPPRGDRARQSLLWSLEALNARVVAEAGLYRPDLTWRENGDIAPGPTRELLAEALRLL